MAVLIEGVRNVLLANGVTPVHLLVAPQDGRSGVVVRPYSAEKVGDLPLSAVAVQVKATGNSFLESEALSWQAYNVLIDPLATVACDRLVLSVTPKQEPYWLGEGDDGKHVHVFNVDIYGAWK